MARRSHWYCFIVQGEEKTAQVIINSHSKAITCDMMNMAEVKSGMNDAMVVNVIYMGFMTKQEAQPS